MKVFTKTVWQMTPEGVDVVEEQSHEYEGPVAECKGGGGSSTPYYANQDKLFGVQADIAGNLYNQYAAYAPSALDSLAGMTGDAVEGLYTQQLRDRAMADSVAAAGMERQATERQMSSMGVNPNDPRFAGSLRATELRNAATTAQATNKAGFDGDNMAWARAQDFYNSLAGLPSQSATMLASSAQGYGQMAGAQQSQANANAQGYGQFGAMVANSMFADGGEVPQHFALGGSVAGSGGGMPQIGDWRDYPSNYRPERMSTMDKITSVASPVITAAAANQAGKGISKLGREAWDALTAQPAAPVEEMAPTALNGTEATATSEGLATSSAGQGAAAAGETAGAASGAAAGEAAGTAAAEGVATEAAGAAASEAAAAEAAAMAAEAGSAATTGAMSAVSTAMPYVGAAVLAAQALDLFKDGGEVREGLPTRQDLTAGGPVPGKPDKVAPDTSDHKPAWLTPKEFVLNTHAAKIAGKKDLTELNQAGLDERRGADPKKAKQKGKAAMRRIKQRVRKAKGG